MDVPVEMGMEDTCRLDCNEMCRMMASPSHTPPLLFIPFSVVIGNNDQEVSRNLQREGEVVQKTGQTGFFSHTGSQPLSEVEFYSDETQLQQR